MRTIIDFDQLRYTNKVVFTNGCFDLLHYGHKFILTQSKSYGDYLIVGLNSDCSVKKLKGESRPIQNQEIRRKKLLELPYVDSVIIFNEDTPRGLIELIKPHVLVKGGDYTIETIVGAKETIERGGEVKIVPIYGDYSTSKIILDMI